jgi:SAM-dependent methyltransferase
MPARAALKECRKKAFLPMVERSVALDCPLCRGRDVAAFVEVDQKQYLRCPTCQLTFVAPAAWLSQEAEHTHYLSHENNVDDPGYRRFLSRLADPLLERLPVHSCGLDYGCGPGPALAHILREAGHDVALYDPFFEVHEGALAATYDFVTCTEVAEHFHDPAKEFDLFDRLLRPGGWLGIMTCFLTDDDKFAAWHYRKDPTHVVFYKHATLAMIASRLGWHFENPDIDIGLMRKPNEISREAS